MENRMDARQELISLKRGLQTLQILSRRRTVSISEAARELGLPRSTAERVLVTLERERYVQRDPQSKRYGLAARVLALSGGFLMEDRLAEAARPLLFAKTRQIGWPLAIAVPLDERMVVQVTTDPATSLGLHKRHVGSEIAMAGSSSGILHLAFLGTVERDQQLALLASSEDPAQVLARNRKLMDFYIEQARRQGYFVGPDLGRERAVSVPVLAGGRAIAVLLMMYIARGVSDEVLVSRFVPELKALADAVSAAVAAAPAPEPGAEG